MSIRWTEDQLAAHQARMLQERSGSTQQTKPHKYRAQPTVVDGMRFDSKAEARYYENLKGLVASETIEYFLRQVPLHLAGGVILRVDFLVMWPKLTELSWFAPRYVDVKGHVTREFLTKKRIAEATYPIKIEIVRWKGGRWIYE